MKYGINLPNIAAPSVRRKMNRKSKRIQLTLIEHSRVRLSKMLKHCSLAAVLVLASVPVAAQTSEGKSDALDPKRKICEKVEVTGSRLRTQKVCMTAEQWEAKRMRDREELEKAQQSTDPSRSG